MVSFKSLAIVALSAGTVAAQIKVDSNLLSSVVGPYATMPIVSDLLSVYDKYQTVSGFDKFQEGFINSLLDYALKGDVPTSIPTATDPAVLVNDPAFKKINSEVAGIITQYIATETYLAQSDKMALATDLLSVSSKISIMAKQTDVASLGAASAGKAQSGSDKGGAAPGPVSAGVKLAAVAGAAVVAVAYVL